MNIQLDDFLFKGGKAARPIPDKTVIDFVNNKVSPKYLYDDKILPLFLDTYYNWLQQSKLNKLEGLDKFKNIDFVHGTSQAFDFFYMKHHDKRLRCFKGDYVYHKVSWNSYFNWKYIEDGDLKKGDALIVSVPFSDYGSIHPDLERVLKICDAINIPVFIDAAYYAIARDLVFNLDRPCIETVTFSMSKPFYGTERLRIGIRCKKEVEDDGIVLFNGFHCVSKIAAGVGYELCQNFNIDYNQNKYREKQIQVCKELKIEPSNCILFGITDQNHPIYGTFDRGTDWRRVCISRQLGDCYDLEF